MNIVLFGPQGSGKGTEAQMLKTRYALYHLSTGDELRAEVKRGTELGKKLAEIMNAGKLVPSEMLSELIISIGKRPEAKHGIIFDGYPRTKDQLDFLLQHYKIDAAVELSIPEQTSIDRIASRRTCPECKTVYNTITAPPKVPEICDCCKIPLFVRDDDKPEKIRERLNTYRLQTEPLKQEFHRLNIFYQVDATRLPAEVDKSVDKIIAPLINR